MTEAPPRSAGLQVLRGLAALAVMVMHCLTEQQGLAARASDPALFWVTRAACSIGGAGVDLFFVISGAVIAVSAERAQGVGLQRAIAFGWRRALRIYPAYWAALGVAAWIAWRGGGADAWTRMAQPRVLLLLTPVIPSLPQAWTLAYEIWFYAGTAALLALLPPARFRAGLAGWGLLHAGILLLPVPRGALLYPFQAPQVLEFFIGALCVGPALRAARSAPGGRALAMAGVALGVIGVAINFIRLPGGSLSDWERVALCGLPSALVARGMLATDMRLRGARLLRSLGDWSYTVYLWHVPVLSAAFVLLPSMPFGLRRAALSAAATLALAPLLFRAIERPAMRLAAAGLPGGRRASPPRGAVSTEVK